MIEQYLKQAIQLLKDNKLLSLISIIGTALAISIIMVIIILLRAKTADYQPEVNRSRMLYVKWGSAVKKDDNGHRNYSRLSLYDIQQAFYPLETPETVTAVYSYGSMLSAVPGSDEEMNSNVLYTDANFWKVNEFGFLAGKPYDQAIFDAGFKQAVINETTARRLFGGAAGAIDRQIYLNFVEFTVCGVVKDVSKFAELSYADVWLPYTSNKSLTVINTSGWGNGHSGNYSCYILARSSDDFPAIREELKNSVEKMNANSPEFKLDIMEQPNTFFEQMLRKFANESTPVKQTVIQYGIIILVILLVPAINLSGLTHSRMRKRMSELGVRKAFGATKGGLLQQVLSENFLLTLAGGIIGLVFSYLCLWLLSGWLMASDLGGVATINVLMISPWIFLIALIVCLILNLLSAGIPAWRAARVSVVDSINER